jgi:alkylation response protein AidB-like acyl-CoA dehydrogenase
VTASAPTALHIAGSAHGLSAAQRDAVAIAATLGRERFAPRAARHDREASFPVESLVDLRDAGLLALCVPKAHGGAGADFATCALVVAEIGRWCGATALTYGTHLSACMWSSVVADALPMTPAQRSDHEQKRAEHFRRIVQEGHVYSQSFAEGGAAAAGKAAWSTLARPVEGGYVVNGRKIFASLSGVAQHYGVLCTLDRAGATPRDALFLAVPADAPGVSVVGDWDPLGMRGTVSRTLLFEEVFVPASERLLPEGLYFEAASRYPHMFTVLSATYMGIAQAAYDFTVQYLRGEVAGTPPTVRRMYPTKQAAVAEMRIRLEQTRALFLQNAREAGLDPDRDARLRLLAAHYTVMENANDIARLAVRTCGGHGMLRSLPLERLYRDSRCGSLMLPLTAELCIDRLGREGLYGDGEQGEAIEP